MDINGRRRREQESRHKQSSTFVRRLVAFPTATAPESRFLYGRGAWINFANVVPLALEEVLALVLHLMDASGLGMLVIAARSCLAATCRCLKLVLVPDSERTTSAGVAAIVDFSRGRRELYSHHYWRCDICGVPECLSLATKLRRSRVDSRFERRCLKHEFTRTCGHQNRNQQAPRRRGSKICANIYTLVLWSRSLYFWRMRFGRSQLEINRDEANSSPAETHSEKTTVPVLLFLMLFFSVKHGWSRPHKELDWKQQRKTFFKLTKPW